jgi:hypothetical protein
MPWDRVAFRVSDSDVDELVRIMGSHGWRMDDVAPDAHARMRCVWFVRDGDDATLPGEPDLVDRTWIRPDPATPQAPWQPPQPAPPNRAARYFWRGVIAGEVWDHFHDEGD